MILPVGLQQKNMFEGALVVAAVVEPVLKYYTAWHVDLN